MIRTHIALLFGISLAAATAAPAQENDFWGRAGNWEISIDPSLGHGCYLLHSWPSGTILRMGLDPQNDLFYLLIGNEGWTSLQPGQDYEIQIQFGRRSPWNVTAEGFQFDPGEETYLNFFADKTDFIREFRAAANMRLSYDGQEIDNLSLSGSSRAWNEVETCQRQMNRRQPHDDPFASGEPTGGDPFATGGQKKDPSSKKGR